MIKLLRENKGWSQAKLAQEADIARASISAIETGKMSPSVHTALRIGRALGVSVEQLFGETKTMPFDRWTGATSASEKRYWRARVGELNIAYPIESLPTGMLAPDGQLDQAEDLANIRSTDLSTSTLVVATCDPLIGLLKDALADKGIRLIALMRTSRAALRMLERGLIHVAGIHFGTTQSTDLNLDAALRLKTQSSYTLMRYANWTAGIAIHEDIDNMSLQQLFDGAYRWVNRPLGSSARSSFDNLIRKYGSPTKIRGYELEAPSHQAVATFISTGSAQAGWTLETTATQQGLGFRPVHTDLYDLCFSSELAQDRRIQALIECVQDLRFRQILDACPGITAKHTGELIHAYQ